MFFVFCLHKLTSIFKISRFCFKKNSSSGSVTPTQLSFLRFPGGAFFEPYRNNGNYNFHHSRSSNKHVELVYTKYEVNRSIIKGCVPIQPDNPVFSTLTLGIGENPTLKWSHIRHLAVFREIDRRLCIFLIQMIVNVQDWVISWVFCMYVWPLKSIPASSSDPNSRNWVDSWSGCLP